MRKSSVIRIIIAFCLLLSMSILSSCGEDNSSPTSTPEALSTATFHDPPLTIVQSSEGGGLFSWLIDLISEGLREGATIWIADNTTGRILDYITNKFFENSTDKALDEMNEKLEKVFDQLGKIEGTLKELGNQLSIDTNDLKNYLDGMALQTYASTINTMYDTSDTHGLLGLSKFSTTVDQSDPTAVEHLKASVHKFYTDNDPHIRGAITGLHDQVCPDFETLNGALKDFADKLILTKVDPNEMIDPAKAMAIYQFLESFFARIINFQTKALILVAEFDNYEDPSGATTKAYLDGTYKTYLEQEVAQFQRTVNYLMLNLADYRTKENFTADSAYLAQGLARDEIFLQVFARARFFGAQLLNQFNAGKGYTLHGAVIVPHDYSPGTQTPVTSLTLKFDGPNNKSFTKKVTATPMKGRYPYTKWAQHTSSPDNHWSFYDFDFTDFTTDIPAGTYQITLVDHGDENIPWFHTSTDMGQVSIMYYDPELFDPATATMEPTAKNTVKFGAFSGRWNWGYNRLSLSKMAQWDVPKKTTHRNKDNPELIGDTQYYPHKKSSGPINQMGLSFSSQEYKGHKYAEYSLNLPFKVSRAPGDDNKAASAQIFYIQGGHVMLRNPNEAKAYVWYRLIDAETKKKTEISTQTVTNFRPVRQYTFDYLDVSEGLKQKSGTTSKITLEPDRDYDLNVDAELAFSAGQYSSSIAYGYAALDLDWNMQVVYMNTYNDIFK